MTLPKEIFIVDEQLKSDIRENPYYWNLAKDFEQINAEKLKGANANLQVKTDNSLVPLKDYKNKGPLVQSELYKNRYYTLFEYVNNSYEELAALMAKLCNFMGNNVKFEFEFYEIRNESNKSGSWTNGEFGMGYEGFFGTKTNSNSSDLQETNNGKGRWISFNTGVEGAKKTPKELKAYIEKEGINIHALHSSFKSLVETYLESPNAKLTHYGREEFSIDYTNKYIQKCQEIASKTSILKIFEVEFGTNFCSKESYFNMIRTKMRYSVTFN